MNDLQDVMRQKQVAHEAKRAQEVLGKQLCECLARVAELETAIRALKDKGE